MYCRYEGRDEPIWGGLCLIIRLARIWCCLEDLISPAVRRSREQAIRGMEMCECGGGDGMCAWRCYLHFEDGGRR